MPPFTVFCLVRMTICVCIYNVNCIFNAVYNEISLQHIKRQSSDLPKKNRPDLSCNKWWKEKEEKKEKRKRTERKEKGKKGKIKTVGSDWQEFSDHAQTSLEEVCYRPERFRDFRTSHRISSLQPVQVPFLQKALFYKLFYAFTCNFTADQY